MIQPCDRLTVPYWGLQEREEKEEVIEEEFRARERRPPQYLCKGKRVPV